MTVDKATALRAERGGVEFYFCGDACRAKFLSAAINGEQEEVTEDGEGPRNTKAAGVATRRHLHEAEAGAVGALMGAGMGAVAAGPPGAVAGVVIGGVAGTLMEWAVETDSAQADDRDRQLDAEIGVAGGDIGVPGLEHPPPPAKGGAPGGNAVRGR
jgi:YHS domain-containing protein